MPKGLWINDKTFISFANMDKGRLTEELATRQGAIDFYSLGMSLPNPDPVLKKQGKDITIYTELLGDAYLGGCVDSRQAGVKSLEWGIDRGKSKSKQAQLIEDLFKNINMEKIIEEAINAPLYGYQVFEIVWEYVGNYLVPKAIIGKPQEWFCFSELNELMLKSKAFQNGKVVDPYKYLLLTHKATYKNPYGFPVLSRCFWPATFKKGGMKFWVMFAEKYGGVFAIGKQPRGTGKAETDQFADTLEQMIQDAVAVIPDDSSVEFMEAQYKGASSEIYKGLRDDCKSEIAIALLGQNLSTEVNGGSYAASKSHMEVRADIIDSDRKLVEEMFNTLIKWIYDLNFGTGERPVFSMWQEEDVDKTLAERDKTLADTGMLRFTKDYFMKNYGFEEGDIEVIENSPAVKPPNFAEQAGVGRRHGQGGTTPLLNDFKRELNSPQFSSVPPKGIYPDQDALDEGVDKLSPQDLQAQAEGLLSPVLSFIEECKDYNEALTRLTEMFPDMSTKEIQAMYERGTFAAELFGMLSAQKDPAQ